MTTYFENNETDFIQHKVRDMVHGSRIGQVVQVYEHVNDDDNTNFEADVNFPNEDLQHRVVPILNPGSDSIDVPRVGDTVLVQYLDGSKKVPIIVGTVDTAVRQPDEGDPPVTDFKDRAVKGQSGMYRRKWPSESSPAGDGDLYFTGATYYEKTPGLNDYRDMATDQAFIRMAKKEDAMDETEDDLPMMIEMYDDPKNGDTWVKIEANKAGGSDSTVSYGFEINLNDGSFKIVDKEGYGIESDGNGNFTWHHESINFSEGTTTSL